MELLCPRKRFVKYALDMVQEVIKEVLKVLPTALLVDHSDTRYTAPSQNLPTGVQVLSPSPSQSDLVMLDNAGIGSSGYDNHRTELGVVNRSQHSERNSILEKNHVSYRDWLGNFIGHSCGYSTNQGHQLT